MKNPPKFASKIEKDFAAELNTRVNLYFKENGLSRYANTEMVVKTIFHLSIWIGTYLLLLLGDFSTPVNYLLWAIMGFWMAMVTVNIGHDAIHGAYSSKKWVNNMLSHTFNFNGASAYMWKKMHNTAHHTYTNVDGFDEDIEPIPIIRISPQKKLMKIHRFQHIYAIFFYGLATISWVFIKDYVKFFKNEVGNFAGKAHPKQEYFYLFFYKIINYTIFLVLPIVLLPQPWGHTVLGFLLMHYIAGVSLGIIFMLAHVVEETHFLMPDHKNQLQHSWAVHQLYTTANFASKSWLASFLTGGLNTQVEHHLFPNVCSIHYRKLAGIVEETARQYNHPYYELSFPGALRSHVRFLRKMGRTKPVTA